MIPKKIHYVWLGHGEKNERTKKCIESWKKITDFIPCEKWTPSNPLRKKAIEFSNELLADSDLRILN